MKGSSLRYFVILSLVFHLTACTAMDAAKIGMGLIKPASNGIAVSAQMGEEANKQVIVGDQLKQELEFENEGDVTYSPSEVNTKITNVSTVFLVLLIIGWVLPTPLTLGKWFVSFIGKLRKRKEPDKFLDVRE